MYIVSEKTVANPLSAFYEMVEIHTFESEGLGSLSVFENQRDIPFEIKRIYYISGVPKGGRRGNHAHKTLWQLIFCPYGAVEFTLDNGFERENIVLDNCRTGLLIKPGVWREMHWLVDSSVVCVAASDFYSPEDYIHDYDEFSNYMRGRA